MRIRILRNTISCQVYLKYSSIMSKTFNSLGRYTGLQKVWGCAGIFIIEWKAWFRSLATGVFFRIRIVRSTGPTVVWMSQVCLEYFNIISKFLRLPSKAHLGFKRFGALRVFLTLNEKRDFGVSSTFARGTLGFWTVSTLFYKYKFLCHTRFFTFVFKIFSKIIFLPNILEIAESRFSYSDKNTRTVSNVLKPSVPSQRIERSSIRYWIILNTLDTIKMIKLMNRRPSEAVAE